MGTYKGEEGFLRFILSHILERAGVEFFKEGVKNLVIRDRRRDDLSGLQVGMKRHEMNLTLTNPAGLPIKSPELIIIRKMA